jgi:hypothetical protein
MTVGRHVDVDTKRPGSASTAGDRFCHPCFDLNFILDVEQLGGRLRQLPRPTTAASR